VAGGGVAADGGSAPTAAGVVGSGGSEGSAGVLVTHAIASATAINPAAAVARLRQRMR
jgi:hypothetical protein